MTVLSLLFLLATAGVLQAVIPPVAVLGRAPLPVLAALVVYYALTRETGFMLAAAVLAGVVHDALGLVPLGYSSCCFGLGALLVHRFRRDVFAWEWLTRLVMGGAVAGGTVLGMSLLLRATRQIELPATTVAVKTLGSVLLGAALVPLVCALAEGLDRRLDLLEGGRP